MSLFSITLDQPGALLFSLLIIPAVWIGWRFLTGMSVRRRALVCGVRAVVIFALAFALAEPKWRETSDSVSVTLLVDRSRSIRADLETQALQYLRDASENVDDRRSVVRRCGRPGLRDASENVDDRRPIDRLAVINIIGGKARIQCMPNEKTVLVDGVPAVDLDATNLANGVRMALAIAPQDMANRFVLTSDENETTGNVLAAAELAERPGPHRVHRSGRDGVLPPGADRRGGHRRPTNAG